MKNNKVSSEKPYEQLAKYYDKFTNISVLDVYKKMLGKPKGSRILDLGCGTGTLLCNFSRENETYGIDESAEMINIAKTKDRKSAYSMGDIKSFKTTNKFDVITCAFDTVNHLSTLKEWEQLFIAVNACLNETGIFIFDFNTIEGFDQYSRQTIYKNIDNNHFIMRAKVNGQICFWAIDGFIKEPTGLFKHTKITIKERSYPTTLIIKKVEKYFSIVDVLKTDPKRIYIKAKKKQPAD